MNFTHILLIVIALLLLYRIFQHSKPHYYSKHKIPDLGGIGLSDEALKLSIEQYRIKNNIKDEQ